MAEQYANGARTVLAEALDGSETGVDVDDASAFPATGDFRILVTGPPPSFSNPELMKVTSVSGNTFTVVRGAEEYNGSSTPVTHANGDLVFGVLTVASLPTGGGVTLPTIVQRKFDGAAISSITLDSTPTPGNSIILVLDGFNTGQATSISSSNTTWTKMLEFNNAGGQKAAIWVGVVAASPGAAITITHPNSFMSALALEVTDALTPTLGQSDTAEVGTDGAFITGVTPGSLVVATGGCDNTTLINTVFALGIIPIGVQAGIIPVIIGYALGDEVDASATPQAGAIMLAEIT